MGEGMPKPRPSAEAADATELREPGETTIFAPNNLADQAREMSAGAEAVEEIAGWVRGRQDVVLTLRSKEEGSSALLKAGGSFKGELQFNPVVGGELYLEDINAGRVSKISSEGNGVFAVSTEDGAIYELKKAPAEERVNTPEQAPVPVEAVSEEEPFPTAEATREQFPDLPKEFEKVIITKVLIKEGQTSSVPPGARYEGLVLGDIAEGKKLTTTVMNTGAIERGGISRVGEGKFKIETETSTYLLEKAA
jgi:hypothetical protein